MSEDDTIGGFRKWYRNEVAKEHGQLGHTPEVAPYWEDKCGECDELLGSEFARNLSAIGFIAVGGAVYWGPGI